MIPVRNTQELLATGDVSVRDVLLRVVNDVLSGLNSEKLIKSMVRVTGNVLHIGSRSWDLSGYGNVYVIGAGKACNHMARALDALLGDRIAKGLVIVKQLEEGDELAHIELALGGHPYPNESGWRATRRILDMVDGCTSQDLFITVISGGSSALMNCPVAGVSVAEESLLTEQLLTAGADILEINTVRRHVSAVNGGRLAQRLAARGAEVVSLVISDRVNDAATGTPFEPVPYTGTQIGIDPTSFADAWKVMERYQLLGKAPESVVAHLRKGPELEETPKSLSPGQHVFVIQGLEDGCAASVAAAAGVGVPCKVLTSCLEGDSRQAGMFLGALAREIRCNGRPFAPPCLLVAAGETTVRIDGPAGKGGPSQELALSFARQIHGLEGIGIAAVETEGTDGPTHLAGALTDCTTLSRAMDAGEDIVDVLDRHDSFPLLSRIGDALVTGNTGTNLCDLNLIYIR